MVRKRISFLQLKQSRAYRAIFEGLQISDPITTPWPMPWVTEEIAKYASGEKQMPEEDRFKIYNPEEPDQYVFVLVEKF